MFCKAIQRGVEEPKEYTTDFVSINVYEIDEKSP
jgi:hypothetical protein